MSNNGELRSKTFYVLGFFVNKALWNKEREIGIFVACFFKFFIEHFLYFFPDSIARGTNHHAAFYWGIIRQLSVLNDIQVPLRKVASARSDFFSHKN